MQLLDKWLPVKKIIKSRKPLKTTTTKSHVFISTTQRILGLAGIQIDSVSFVEQLPAVNKEH